MKIYLPKPGSKRKEKVEIHDYDSWNVDHTLAQIILPLLIQLKNTQHGSPFTDDEDVPDELKSTAVPKVNKDFGETDENHFKRWNWVLEQMIYSFDTKVNMEEVYIRIDDMEIAKIEQKKISNGFNLFGKYYEGLWD